MLDKIYHEYHHIYEKEKEKENDIYVIIIVTTHAYHPAYLHYIYK